MADQHESVSARRALLDAAKQLLPERVPSSVAGRELAALAGVNYGLIHHYFGSKDAVFREALEELRAEFLASHVEHSLPALIVESDNPYIRAIGRSQVDYPRELGAGDDFPIGAAVVTGLTERLRARHPDWTDTEVDVEAKARAIAMLGVQLGYSVYNAMLLDTVGVTRRQRASVEATLARLYAELSARP
jgi:AcrR family transcriptional regulator